MGASGMSRRDFLRIGGGAGAGLFFIGQVGGLPFKIPVAAAAIPGGSLDPTSVPKYQTAMLIPPAMPRAGTTTMPGGKPVDSYEISVK
jgi:spore coat protein A, manganese oxidase